MAETLTVQMEKILDAYSDRVNHVNQVAMQRVGRESVKMLRNNSPKKSGSYSRGWRLKTIKSRGPVVDVVIHNATDYQLTHLLEKGHVVRNAKGVYGRAPAHPHIKPVEEWASTELQEEIERELR